MNKEELEQGYDEQEEEEHESKSYRWIKQAIIIALLVSLLLFGIFYYLRSLVAGAQVDSKNSRAETCIKAMNAYFEYLSDNEGFEVPTDKEYVVKGYTDSEAMHIDSCELFKEGGISYYWSGCNLYWAVRVKNGEAFEAWAYKDPITENMMRYYSRSEQVEQYKKHVFSDKVIGYYNSDEGNRYFH